MEVTVRAPGREPFLVTVGEDTNSLKVEVAAALELDASQFEISWVVGDCDAVVTWGKEWVAKGELAERQVELTQAAIVKATQDGNVDDVTLLLEADPGLITAVNPRGDTLLHIALSRQPNNFTLAEVLLTHGADPNKESGMTYTAAHHAAAHCTPKVFDLLKFHGAEMEVAGCDGRVPLHWAAEYGNVEYIKVLAAHGVAIDPVNKGDKETPLFSAIARDHPAAIAALVEHGADVNHQNFMEATPLHHAIERCKPKCFEELLRHSPDLTPTNYEGKTPKEALDSSCVKILFPPW